MAAKNTWEFDLATVGILDWASFKQGERYPSRSKRLDLKEATPPAKIKEWSLENRV